MKNFCCAMLVLFSISSFSQNTTIIVVRHAEKADNGKDAQLSAEGLARAEELKRTLAGTTIDAVYSTPYNRTRQTILPLATEKKVAVTEYAANKPYAQFVKEVLDANRGKTVVVVGHSNTVPEILKILSNAAFSANISESQFDNLFIVTVPNEGNPSVLPLKYGKTTP